MKGQEYGTESVWVMSVIKLKKKSKLQKSVMYLSGQKYFFLNGQLIGSYICISLKVDGSGINDI